MARQFLHIPVLLLLTQLFFRAMAQQCTGGVSEESMSGWMLQGHAYKTMLAELPHTCVLTCRKDDRCQSFNYVISLSMCEFSNRTKEARPEDFIPNPDRFYFRRDENRVPLGSIPELPAETCTEIKASKGGQAVNRKYWFSSLRPGVPVLAYCDMKTEDIDECTAFPSMCHDNANCKNTRGSYRCTCKSGFSGDGKTCKDVDECTSSPSVCDVNANCNNIRGSYGCTCKTGFSGDGKSCTDVDECTASPSVCDVNAICTNTRGSYSCTCKPGFSGDGQTCSDVDECTASPSVCDVNAICTNSRGSYGCTCKTGFSGDGKSCTDVDECTASPSVCDVNAICTNSPGSYGCTCKPGFSGDGKTCAGLALSVIIGKNKNYLTNLNNWLSPVVQSVNSAWKRCWHASVDGWAASTFHAKCDGKGPTVTIIRVGGKYIFGGYTSLSWGSSSGYQFDSKAFLFSLVNKPGWLPVKLSQTGKYSSTRAYSICSHPSYGPTFGGGHDIYVSNQAASNKGSKINLGHTYGPPNGHSYYSTFARTFLAGSLYFTPDEVETFYETT